MSWEPQRSSSSGSGGGSRVPPMATCHQCNITIRPLTSPGSDELTCPRCGGGFVELLPEQDDPDDGHNPFGQPSPATGGGPTSLGALFGGVVQGIMTSALQQRSQQQQQQQQQQQGQQQQGQQRSSTGDSFYSQRNSQPGSPYGQHPPSSSTAGGFRYGQTNIGPIRIAYGSNFGSASGRRSGPSVIRRTVVGGSNGQPPPTLSNFLDSNFANHPPHQPGFSSANSPTLSAHHDDHVHDDGMGGAGGAADGRYFNWDNPDRPQASSLSGSEQQQHRQADSPPLFFGGGGGSGGIAGAQAQDVPPQLEALRGMFSNIFGVNPAPGQGQGQAADGFGLPMGLFAQFFGAGGSGPNGQFGDYVLNQEGLDNIITQLMEQTGQNSGPARASDEAIARLERFDRSDRVRLGKAKNSECATCKEEFIPSETTPAGASDTDDPADVEPDEQENTIVSLPCGHIFHEMCIVDWLRINGSCPICRSPVDPQQQAQSGGSGDQQQQDNRSGGSAAGRTSSPIMSGAPGSSTAGSSSGNIGQNGGAGTQAEQQSSQQRSGGGGGAGAAFRLFSDIASEALRQRRAGDPHHQPQQPSSGARGSSSSSTTSAASPLQMPGGWDDTQENRTHPAPAQGFFSSFPSAPNPIPAPSSASPWQSWPSPGSSSSTRPGPSAHASSAGSTESARVNTETPTPEDRRRILREAAEARMSSGNRSTPGSGPRSSNQDGGRFLDADAELD